MTPLTKKIRFEFYNSFTDEYLGGVEQPYDRLKSSNNHYSKFYKKWKLFIANMNSINTHFVKAKIIKTV